MTTPTENADFLFGDDTVNLIFGLGGNDSIFGHGDEDLLDGGAGNDILAGGSGNDALHGGIGDDLLIGGAGNDFLNGGADFDIANYNDNTADVYASLTDGHATRTVAGLLETDTLSGIEGLTGGGGRDILGGDEKANTLSGMDGNDWLYGQDGVDTINGGNGSDFLFGGTGGDILNGGLGNDAVAYTGSTTGVTVNLLTGAHSGGEADGDVYISIESVEGSELHDILTGDAGDNHLFGAGGADTLDGGEGNDIVEGGEGADTMIGGAGFDTLWYGYNSPAVVVDLLKLTSSGGETEGDVFSGFENVAGTQSNDKLYGDNGANYLKGYEGNDIANGRGGDDLLVGQQGGDHLSGGAGHDVLNGGAGRDVMAGGAGNDRFEYFTSADSGITSATRDVIGDFMPGSDTINLLGIDANLNLAGNQAFAFINSQGFSQEAGELHSITSGANTILEGDMTGDGVADFQIQFTGVLTFTAADFSL